MTIDIDPHPLLELRWFEAEWPTPVAEVATPAWLDPAVARPSLAPPEAPDAEGVRALLRHGGFKPAGRSKPCSEYIRKAVEEGRFPRINAVVDLTNLAVFHGGLPVSTVDPDRLVAPLRVGLAPPGSRYVFNAGGQELDLGGLLCLWDAAGPCANAVKDAQRAKTTPETRRTLSVVWGTTAAPGRALALGAWMLERTVALGGVPSRLH